MMSKANNSVMSRADDVRPAIILLLLIPILVPLLAVALIWISERDPANSSEQRVLASAKLSATNFTFLVNSTRERLRRIDEGLGADPSTFQLKDVDPAAGFIGLYDAEGLTIGPDGSRGVSVADNAEFKSLAGGQPQLITPLIGSTGSIHLFGIARRLDRSGRFAGVVTAYVPADFLSGLWSTVALGPDSTLGLFRSDGWMITRYPVPEKAADLSGYELFTQKLKVASQGVYHARASPVDGVARTVGYTTIPDLGVIAVASMSEAAAAGGFWARVRSIGLVSTPFFLALVVMCLWTALLLRRQERARLRLSLALDQNRVLLQEIHHRVKNNLQSVAAMVRLQAAPAEMKNDLMQRIAAITTAHQHIYETDQFGAVDAAGYLGKLLESIRTSAPAHIELDWELTRVDLSPDRAMPLGLLVNELVTNALKHGFPDGRPGHVQVVLGRQNDNLVLTVADDGVGTSGASKSGLGGRLIAAFVEQLAAKAAVSRQPGYKTTITFGSKDPPA